MPPQETDRPNETPRDPVEIRQDAAISIQEALLIAAEQSFPIGKSTLQRWAKTWAERGAGNFVATSTSVASTFAYNVGIGTTAPNSRLDVYGVKANSGSYANGVLVLADTSSQATGVGGAIQLVGKFTDAGAYTTGASIETYKINSTSGDYKFGLKLNVTPDVSGPVTAMTILNNGNVGIGVTSPQRPLSVGASGLQTGNGLTTNANGLVLVQDAAAHKIIGYENLPMRFYTNASQQLTISAAGAIQFNTYGAGTLQTDASGNITAASDERLKNIQGTFVRSLADIEKLSPILYKWKPETGFDASTTYAGFSAQNVQAAIPEAVGQGKDGFLTLQDRPLIAAAVNAIKEIATITGTFKANLIAWLGDAQNGIQDLFAKNLHAENICADRGFFNTLMASSTLTSELCVDDVCVTRDQFKAMVEGSVLGAPTQSASTAAGAPAIGESGTPGGSSAPVQLGADTSTSTPLVSPQQATSSPPVTAASSTPAVAPANDNQASSTLPAANDNAPVTPTAATGTDASSTAQ